MKKLLNTMIFAGILMLAIALVVELCQMYIMPEGAEVHREVQMERRNVGQGSAFDKLNAETLTIPAAVQGSEEELTAIGVETLPIEMEWPDHEGEKPPFYYTTPWLWENKVYRIVGTTSDFVVKCGNNLMWISNYGLAGPVWKSIADREGTLIGVTENYFLFEDNGLVYAVGEGNVLSIDEISEDELATKKEVKPRNLSFGGNVQVNSWDDKIVELTLDRHTLHVKFNVPASKADSIPLASKSYREWYEYTDGRLFFVQDMSSHKEAVFIGGINGITRVMVIPFIGEFEKADSKGIYYIWDDEEYFKSFVPIFYDDYAENYPEVPAEILNYIEFPDEIGSKNDIAISAQGKVPF